MQRTEPAVVHSCTVPHHQEDGGERCHEETRLLSQVLKLLERGLGARIRRRVEGDFGEEQQGFGKGRETADGIYVLGQMVEKGLGFMALWFVGLEKAFDTVPR